MSEEQGTGMLVKAATRLLPGASQRTKISTFVLGVLTVRGEELSAVTRRDRKLDCFCISSCKPITPVLRCTGGVVFCLVKNNEYRI